MSSIPSSLAQSVASVNQAQRSQSKEKERADSARPRRLRDAYEATQVEAAEAVRNLKGNDQEETHEDRTAHDGYDPRTAKKRPRHIDVEG